jgi:adenine C2-methylase RlmN of 23S rRNA A2503 and tRNA A37
MATERPTVEQIMQEVAANQDRAQHLRREFVYRQNVIVRLTRGRDIDAACGQLAAKA